MTHRHPGQTSPILRSTIAALLSLVAPAVVLAGCPESPPDDAVEFSTDAVCDDGAPAYDATLTSRLGETGPSPNDIAAGDDALWIVESDGNTAGRFDLAKATMHSGWIDVGNERNPYGVAVDDTADEVWIANFLSHTVTVADGSSGEVITEIDDPILDNPSAIAITDDFAYIGNVAFRSTEEGYGPGTIGVVDRSDHSVVDTIETAYKNPQFLSVTTIDDRQVLLASSSGAVRWDAPSDTTRVESEGGLQWFDIEADPTEPDVETYPIGQAEIETVGAPGRPLLTPDQSTLYFASGIDAALFAFDVEQRQWRHDAADPLELYDTDSDATHRGAIGSDGLLWVTDFNNDRLHLVDTACDRPVIDPIGVGAADELLEGPQAITVVDGDDGIDGIFVFALANAAGRLTLHPSEP